MSGPARPRSTSNIVAHAPGCLPLKMAYERATSLGPKTWQEVEDLFLRGMEGFDANVASGLAEMGELQNGKGDFFNDLLALLLENCANVQLYSRAGVPGLMFPKHNLDVTFPNSGLVEFTLEAKAVGTPKHPGSPKAKPAGRPGSADLDKRVKEINFKTIDLKAEYSRRRAGLGVSPTPISGDLTSWLRAARPHSYVFVAARVIDDADLKRAVRLAELAALVNDAVGLFCFMPVSPSELTRYKSVQVPSPIDISRVLFRACSDLGALRGAGASE